MNRGDASVSFFRMGKDINYLPLLLATIHCGSKIEKQDLQPGKS